MVQLISISNKWRHNRLVCLGGTRTTRPRQASSECTIWQMEMGVEAMVEFNYV